MVALKAASHNVVPSLSAPFDNWKDVIKRQILGRTFFAAILAGVVISGVDIRPAEFYVLELLSDLYIFQQTEDTGHLDCEADAANFAVIFGQDFDFALIKQAKRPFQVTMLIGS